MIALIGFNILGVLVIPTGLGDEKLVGSIVALVGLMTIFK